MNTEATTAAPVKAPKAAPKKAPAPKAKKAPATKEEAPAKKSASGARPAPSAGAPSTKSVSADKPDPALAKLDKDLARSKERLAKPKAPAKAAPKKAPAKPAGVTYKSMAASHTGASTIDHPVKAMWDLCDKMKDSRRKDVIAAAVAAGIGYYTARTQYQLWLTAFRNS